MLQCGPVVADARWLTSKMDFRSNEAGRSGSNIERGRIPFLLKPPVLAAGASSRNMKLETLSVDFTDEQKRYLEGFTTGLQISRVGRGLGGSAGKANTEPTGPDA